MNCTMNPNVKSIDHCNINPNMKPINQPTISANARPTTIIFDYDGTLHESLRIYAPAFRKACTFLYEQGAMEQKQFTDAEISHWLGYSSKDMWNSFLPNLPTDLKNHCSQLIGTTMIELIKEGKATLYPDATTLLQKLKKAGYHLVFLSNCKEAYLNAHRDFFKLDHYFDAFYCTETYNFAPKYMIFEEIKKQFPGTFLIVGDRFQDMEVAIKHQLPSIGCLYGYGTREELQEATYLVDEVCGIEEVLLNGYNTL